LHIRNSDPYEGVSICRIIHSGPGMVTAKVMDQFIPIVKRGFNQIVNELISTRLKEALKKENEAQEPLTKDKPEKVSKIVTTEEEKEAFLIIKSILRQKVPVERIAMRDAQSYCAILLDDNRTKTICRLYFNGNKKRIGIIEGKGKEAKVDISTLDDVYSVSDGLLKAVGLYN